jgi:hypothetical protein
VVSDRLEALKTQILMAAGWAAISNVIVERQQALGLDVIDLSILLHLALYWWTPDNKAHPSKSTVAAAMDIRPRTVQRGIAQMEKDGLIRREERGGRRQGSKSNLCRFNGLIKDATPLRHRKVRRDRETPGRAQG